MDLEMMKLSKEEHDRWTELCKKLVEIGAVTADDLYRPVADQSTPGARLFKTITRWGEALVTLRKAVK